MDSKHGIAALFNFYQIGEEEPRKFSNFDLPKLTTCLSDYCEIQPHFDLKQEECLCKLEEVANIVKEKQDYKFLLVFISSHGLDGEFLTSDGSSVSEEQVFEKFKDLMIPKVFIFQFCRGYTLDVVDGKDSAVHKVVNFDKDGKDLSHPLAYNLNHQTLLKCMPRNSIVIYSTCIDRQSLRWPGGQNWEAGGVFVTAFTQAFETLRQNEVQLNNYTGKLDLFDILTTANRILSDKEFVVPDESAGAIRLKYVAHYASTLEKRFYFDEPFEGVQ